MFAFSNYGNSQIIKEELRYLVLYKITKVYKALLIF